MDIERGRPEEKEKKSMAVHKFQINGVEINIDDADSTGKKLLAQLTNLGDKERDKQFTADRDAIKKSLMEWANEFIAENEFESATEDSEGKAMTLVFPLDAEAIKDIQIVPAGRVTIKTRTINRKKKEEVAA